ncbi:MAG TPA: hypothetical protein VGV89_09320 [Thermoplasmata archaeon]|nr:hypothetical protein [Thermoplasmata archaeon]
MAVPNPAASQILQSLSGHPKLLMKMRILSLGKNYDVMDENQQTLCQVGLDSSQNMKGAVVGSAVASVAGDFVGRLVQRNMQYTYTVKDPAGNLAYEIRKGSGAYTAEFQVVDPTANAVVGTIGMKRSFIGGLKAVWMDPAGQTLLSTKGNIIRRKYMIMDATGKAVGHVRHKILAIRDVWELDLEPQVNHLYSALFATVLDFEKKM